MTEAELLKSNELVKQYGPAPEIDLGKIKNAKTAGVSKELKQKIETSVKREKKNKFCFTEEQEIELPTKGKLYQDSDNENLRNGIVRVRPMSLADEETITNQSYIKNGTVFTHLLENCIVDDIDVKKLVPYDVYYLLYTLRKITYGEDYRFEVTCPECGKKYIREIDISDVEWETLEEVEDFTKTIKLPVSKYTVVIEAASLGNEEEVNRLGKTSDTGEVILGYVARTREILDDEGNPVNPKDFIDFYTALPGRDRSEISKNFKKIDDLKIPTVELICPKCGKEDEATIPFEKDFFRY